MTARLLAKILPHSTNLTNDGSASSKPLFSASDVAAALAYGSLPKPAYHLGMAKYCNDLDAERHLLKHLHRKIQYTITRKKWRNAEHRAENLALLVIRECIHEGRCKRCDGHGFIVRLTGKDRLNYGKPCKACDATGIARLSATQQAKIANISTPSWIKIWRPRHENFVQYAHDLESRVSRHLKQQLL